MLKIYLIFELLHSVNAVFGTASVVQTINKSPLYDWRIIALPLVYQIVSEHI